MVGSAVREIIAPVLRECPPQCGITSITSVDVSDDFSYATVYISTLQEPQMALDFLERKTMDLQRQLVKLDRKKIPRLRFRLDRQGERGSRIDELLKESEKVQ